MACGGSVTEKVMRTVGLRGGVCRVEFRDWEEIRFKGARDRGMAQSNRKVLGAQTT